MKYISEMCPSDSLFVIARLVYLQEEVGERRMATGSGSRLCYSARFVVELFNSHQFVDLKTNHSTL